MTVGARSVLPVDGVHLILGNDLAGDKVVVNSIMTDKPVLEEVYDPIIEDVLDLYPACAVTQAMAHETALSGHLGVNKAYYKILEHFYWPKLRKNVSEYCRTCHTCQVVGKPNQKRKS